MHRVLSWPRPTAIADDGLSIYPNDGRHGSNSHWPRFAYNSQDFRVKYFRAIQGPLIHTIHQVYDPDLLSTIHSMTLEALRIFKKKLELEQTIDNNIKAPVCGEGNQSDLKSE